MGYYAEYFYYSSTDGPTRLLSLIPLSRYTPSVPGIFTPRSKPYWYLEIYFFCQSPLIRSKTVFVALISIVSIDGAPSYYY